MKEKTKDKKESSIGSIVVWVIIIAISFTYCSQNQTTNQDISVYDNEVTGISLEYHSDWTSERLELTDVTTVDVGSVLYPKNQPATNFRANLMTTSFEIDTSLFGEDLFLKEYMNQKLFAYSLIEFYSTNYSKVDILGTKGYILKNKKVYADHTTMQVVGSAIKDNRLYEIVFSAEEKYFDTYANEVVAILSTAKIIPIKKEDTTIKANTYVNNKEGYSISYPSNWILTDVPYYVVNETFQMVGISPKIAFTPYKVESVTISVLDSPAELFSILSFKEFLEVGLKAGKDAYGEDYTPIEEIYVSGFKAYKTTVTIKRDKYTLKQTSTHILVGKKDYIIGTFLSDLLSPKYSADIEQMVRTFRFT